jgi:ABC-type dipeptide/oligopeptide/nickel transport system permease subunit
VFLLLVALSGAAAPWLAPYGYQEMFRDDTEAGVSAEHPLGTDASGRDRLSRSLYGTAVSIWLAPAAALLSTLIAASISALSVAGGPLCRGSVLFIADLFLCLPWMFLLIAVRALLPLNATPATSVAVTFLVLSCLGWAGPARMIQGSVVNLMRRDDRLLARALGVSAPRWFGMHLAPNLRPVLNAQFWLAIPVFILSEANLSIIGLGVSEPLPSWGNLIREIDNFDVIRTQPWVLAPLALLVVSVICVQAAIKEEPRSV